MTEGGRSIRGWLLCVGLLAAIPILVYFKEFAGAEVSSDPAHWSDLGSFLSGTTGLILSGANLAVVLYLALLARRWSEADARDDLAFELHREWNSSSMYAARTQAREVLRLNPDERLDKLDLRIPTALDPVWVVTGFFQRLAVLSGRGAIKQRDLRELFGIFVWWDVFCFRDRMPSEWEPTKRLAELRRQYATWGDLQAWEDLAKKDAAKLAALGGRPEVRVVPGPAVRALEPVRELMLVGLERLEVINPTEHPVEIHCSAHWEDREGVWHVEEESLNGRFRVPPTATEVRRRVRFSLPPAMRGDFARAMASVAWIRVADRLRDHELARVTVHDGGVFHDLLGEEPSEEV